MLAEAGPGGQRCGGTGTSARELPWLAATEIAPLVRRKTVSPVEGAEAVLAHVAAHAPRINAFAELLPDRFMAAVRAAAHDPPCPRSGR